VSPKTTKADSKEKNTRKTKLPYIVGAIGEGGASKKPFGGYKFAQVRAFVITALQQKKFWQAFMITLGFVSFSLFFPFYTLFLPILAIIIFVVSYSKPIFGTVLSFVLILPAMSYQTPTLAWLFLVAVGIMLFKVFDYWYMIAALLAVISSPFVPSPYNLLVGPAVIPILLFSAMRMGSKKAAFFIPIAIYIILLLSVIWQTPNSAFLTVGDHIMARDSLLVPSKIAPEPAEMLGGIGVALGNLFSFDVVQDVSIAIDIVSEGTSNLFFADAGLLQIVLWSIVFYAVAFIPRFFHGKYQQLMSALPLLFLIVIHLLSSSFSEVDPNFGIIPAVGLTLGVVYLMDKFEIKITREKSIEAEKKRGAFGLPGIVDMSVQSGGPKSLKDVGNYDATKKEIMDSILLPIKHKELTLVYGVKPPKGILLFGPPGTGKTFLMSAMAKEMRMNFYYVKTSDLLTSEFGASEKNIAELFKNARKSSPAVLFFDEIDAIGRKRGMYQSDDVMPRILSALLTEMDGVKTDEQVIVVAATNTPNVLDPALLRPGRFDKIIYMPPPDAKGRKEILKIYTKKLPIASDVDLDKLAKITERFTGAGLANLVIEAARRTAPEAVEEGKIVPIEMKDFEEVAKSLKPATTFEMLEDYQKFRTDFERRTFKEELKPVEERKITWDDVIGLDDVRKVLTEAIELPLLHEEELKKYKVKPAKGLLLFGPPGVGKTMIVKAASTELNATFVSISPSDLSRRGYENSVKVIKETINRARENAPAILFIDELESIAPSRGKYSSKITEEVVTTLLQELDGVKNLKNVIFVGATNKPSVIDTALLRPGRIDKIIFVGPPTKDGRIKLFKANLEGVSGSDKLNYDKLAEETEGYTGADITGICQDVKLDLVRAKIAGELNPSLNLPALRAVIGRRPRSVTVEMLQEYLDFVKKYGERR